MALTEDQIVDAQEAFDSFRVVTKAFAPFATDAVRDENLKIMSAWGAINISGGLAAGGQVGFWELSFRACLAASTLTKDPSYIRPLSLDERKAIYSRLYQGLASDQLRAIYENKIQEHFRPLTETKLQQLVAIGGPDVFRRFVDEGK